MPSASAQLASCLLLCCCVSLTQSSNWAQLSGSNVQNTVSSDEHPPWTGRWGFASVVVQQVVLVQSGGGGGAVAGASPSPSPVPKKSAPSVLLIMGGEDWSGDATGGDPLSPQPTAGTTGGNLGGASNGHAQDFLGNALLPNAPPMEFARPATGFGQLHNDVYLTGGASWRVYTDHRQVNAYGEPAPVIASNVSWSALPPWGGFPDAYKATGWKDYLGCCHPSRPFVCSKKNVCPLDDNGQPYDNLAGTRRWSPRRGAAAVAIVKATGEPPAVFMLGGRAVSFENVEGAQGGAAWGQADTKHSPSRLMNDVWVSLDSGLTWDFANAGCWGVNDLGSAAYPGLKTSFCTHTDNCTTLWNLGPEAVCWFGPGSEYGASSAAAAKRGTCVCSHWSPREHHAATVSWLTGTPVIYVSGGVSWVTESLCGEWSCGASNVKLNTDVWSSGTQGVTWAQITGMAIPEDASGRSDHGMIYAAQLLYLLGGRGYAPEDRGVDVFYASGYTSQVGITWAPAAAAPAYGARAAFSLTTDGNALYMFGGAVPVSTAPPLADAGIVGGVEAATAAAGAAGVAAAAGIAPPAPVAGSGWSGSAAYSEARGLYPGELLGGLQRDVTSHFFTLYVNDLALEASPFFGAAKRNTWYTDFANPHMPLQQSYIHAHWPLSQPLDILNVSAGDAAVLAGALNILDAWGLANIAPSSILLCQDVNQLNIPGICAYKRAAQGLVNLCSPRFRPWTTWNYDLQTLAGAWPLLETAVDTSYPTGWRASNPPADDGCSASVGPIVSPYSGLTASPGKYVCRSVPPPRRHGALLAMDGKVYAAGGWLAPNTYTADLWYRDDVAPRTRILHAPEDGGGKEKALDTVLRLGCSEATCIYEARVFAGRGTEPPAVLLRDWALIPSEYECLPISQPKSRPTTIQVRAIDPAGNKDPFPLAVTWTYIAPIPVGTIVLALFGALAFVGLLYWLYRRYQRRRMLEEFAKRRLARAAAEREREKRKFKKVKRLKKVKVIKQTRPRAFNVFSEDQADQQNRFKELLGVRASRNRADRIGLAHDPLAAQRLTTLEPPKPGPTPDMGSAALTRSAKEAMGFNPATLSQKAAHELEKQARAFGTLVDSKKPGGEGVVAQREGAAADFFRTGLQTHADGLAALSKQGVSLERIPAGLAAKVARKQARAAGKKEEDAWEISAMNQSLGQQITECVAGLGVGWGRRSF